VKRKRAKIASPKRGIVKNRVYRTQQHACLLVKAEADS